MQAGSPTLEAGRLATALGVPVEALETTLSEVGVDADYLARALREGDPQGAISAVARRLGLPRPEVVMALVKALATAEGKPAGDLAALLDAAARDLAHPRPVEGDVLVARAPARPAPAPRPAPSSAREPENAVAEFLSERLPAVARRLVIAIVALGAFLLALGGLGLAAPDIFQQALLYLVAIVFLGLGVGLLVLALRLRRLVAAVSHVAKGK